jgi:hypothetical protein
VLVIIVIVLILVLNLVLVWTQDETNFRNLLVPLPPRKNLKHFYLNSQWLGAHIVYGWTVLLKDILNFSNLLVPHIQKNSSRLVRDNRDIFLLFRFLIFGLEHLAICTDKEIFPRHIELKTLFQTSSLPSFVP